MKKKTEFDFYKAENLGPYVNSSKYCRIFEDPLGQAEVQKSHILLFLLNLAYSLIILAVSVLQLLFVRKKNAVKMKLISGVTFSSEL